MLRRTGILFALFGIFLFAPTDHVTARGELSLRSTGRWEQVDACIVLTGYPGDRNTAPIGRPCGGKLEGRAMRQAKWLLSPDRFDVKVVPGAIVLAVPRECDLAAVGRKRRRRYVTRQRSERDHRQLL